VKSRGIILLLGVLAVSCVAPERIARRIPLNDRDYVFSHRFAEHPNVPNTDVAVRVSEDHISISNENPESVLPLGLLEEGTLMWHGGTSKWIIANSEQDLLATEVGGCTDGPATVDLERRIYWTC
jgi:hypothetical protein